MMATPEALARQQMDQALKASGWIVQDYKAINLAAAKGIAVREVPLQSGRCDYLLLVDRIPVGVIEAKTQGTTLSTVADQSGHYAANLPPFLVDKLPKDSGILPFCYESTGVETFFRDERDPHPRSRQVFSFHRPETLAESLAAAPTVSSPSDGTARTDGASAACTVGVPSAVPGILPGTPAPTLRARFAQMPFAHPLVTTGIRDCQVEAITKLEQSLAEARPRAPIQMATGAGKTFTACAFTHRLIKHAEAKRVLFLVDRASLGKQAAKINVPGRREAVISNPWRTTSPSPAKNPQFHA